MRLGIAGTVVLVALVAGACGSPAGSVETAPATSTTAPVSSSTVAPGPVSVSVASGQPPITTAVVLAIPKITSRITSAASCLSGQSPSSGVGDRYVMHGDFVYYTGRAEPCGGWLADVQPQVRRLDLRTGKVDVVADWAYAPVVSIHGRLAYAQGPARKFGLDDYHSWFSTVVVETNGVTQTWTDPTQTRGRYTPLAWAGNTLLAAFENTETGTLELRALRGPGDETAWGAMLHAVSPDRTLFLVNEDPAKNWLVVYSADTLKPVAGLSYADYLAVIAPGLNPGDYITPQGFFPPAEGSLSTHFGDIWLPDGTIIMNADTGITILRYVDRPTPTIEAIKRIPLGPDAAPGVYDYVNHMAVTADGQVAVTGATLTLPGPPPSLPANATPEEITQLLKTNVPAEGPAGFICNIDTGTCTKGQVGNAFEQPEWGLR